MIWFILGNKFSEEIIKSAKCHSRWTGSHSDFSFGAVEISKLLQLDHMRVMRPADRM